MFIVHILIIEISHEIFVVLFLIRKLEVPPVDLFHAH